MDSEQIFILVIVQLVGSVVGTCLGAWLGYSFALKKDRRVRNEQVEVDKHRRLKYLRANVRQIKDTVDRAPMWTPSMGIDRSLIDSIVPSRYEDIANSDLLECLASLYNELFSITVFSDIVSSSPLVDRSPLDQARIDVIPDSISEHLPSLIDEVLSLINKAITQIGGIK